MKKLIILTFIIFFAFSCNNQNSSGGLQGMLNMSETYENNTSLYSYDNSNENEDQKIIKTSYLTFETESVEKTFQQIHKLVIKYKGQIQNDNTYKGSGNITRSLVLRIPINHFSNTIDSISKNVDVFDNKHIKLKNVTEEFIDLEARLKTKKILENRYLQLLSKANTVSEMLEIEKEISKIREEIEAKQGRLNYLENQVSFSTLNLEFYETVEFKVSKSKSYFNKIGKALKGGVAYLGEFIISLIYLWPFILILLIFIVFFKRQLKKKKK